MTTPRTTGTIHNQDILHSEQVFEDLEYYITMHSLMVLEYEDNKIIEEFRFDIDNIMSCGVSWDDYTVIDCDGKQHILAIPGNKYHHQLNREINDAREKRKAYFEKLEHQAMREREEIATKREEEQMYDKLREQLHELEEGDEVTVAQVFKVLRPEFDRISKEKIYSALEMITHENDNFKLIKLKQVVRRIQ
ncbi:MAG: hypothetical protein ACW98K_11245 [Candidatus Kariarchaeaceae archaeon]|jgi:hypothetical protein